MHRKVILITGGSSGLGRAMCKNLADHGYTVYGTSRSAHGIDELDNFKLIRLDVTKEESITAAIEIIRDREGRLDVLVNNAGLSIAGPLEETSVSEMKTIFDTNVFGLLSTTKAALPLLRESRGYLVNISSLAGEIALPYRGVYSASKFAVEALTESLSLELSPFGVKVLLIQPGDLNTNIHQNRAVSPVKQGSVYYETFKRQLEEIEKQMKVSMDPDLIGDLIVEILKDEKPKLRYQVGPFMQKASVRIKKVLPGRAFEKILKKHFGL